MKKRIAIALLAITAAGGAWAFGHSSGGPGCGMRGGDLEGGGMPRIHQRLDPEQRRAAGELFEAGRGESLELRQQLMNQRFEMLKLAQAEQWDQAAAEREAAKGAELIARMMVMRARLQYDLAHLPEAEEGGRQAP